MLRAVLVAALVDSAIFVPWVLWDPPARAPTSVVTAPERPDRVAVATVGDQLPFGCPGTQFCNCDRPPRIALLVQDDALWLGSNDDFAPPRHLARNSHGSEWRALDRVLREVSLATKYYGTLEIAIDDRASYLDLLLAMDAAHQAGARHIAVVQAALPVHPNHGWEGGMAF